MEGSGVVSLDQESNAVVNQLATLEATRNALDLDIETFSKRLSSMEQELPKQESRAAVSISQANDSYIRQLQDQLGRLEVQRDVIVAQSDPECPQSVDVPAATEGHRRSDQESPSAA